MSGARRKSKNPQKWEDSFSSDELSKLPDLQKNVESEAGEMYKAYPEYVPNLNYSLGTDTCGKDGGCNEGEMTVLDVLQGSRQGFVAECKACFIQLKDWSSTAIHIQSHRLVFIPLCVRDSGNGGSKQPATCMLCQKVCQNQSTLAFHVHSKHSLTSPPFVCPFCGRTFLSSSLLQKHADVREVCLKCPVCSATYNQIYELFSHLSVCLPTFHPHLKSLVCHVCKHRILMGSLADHMMHHSLQGHEVEQTKHTLLDSSSSGNPVVSSPPPPDDAALKNMFLCEICDRRFSCFDTFRKHLYDHGETKMYCPSCFLKGFERQELVVRHLMLRCPRRTSEQFEFGVVISLIGKEKRLNFLQVIRDILHLRPFQEGLLAWSPFPMVHELLLNAEKLLEDSGARFSSPTDIDLLTWLSDFERQIQRQHPEIWKEERGRMFESSKSTGNASPMLKIATNRNVTKLDGIITSLNHRPLAHEIRKAYPGVTLLHDVDVKRLKPLYEEAMSLMQKDVLSPYIESGAFTDDDFLRLEWEAQYLREKEPCYFPRGKEWRKFSPSFVPQGHSQKIPSPQIDPETLEKISRELRELQKDITPISHGTAFKKEELDALLQEAKEC